MKSHRDLLSTAVRTLLGASLLLSHSPAFAQSTSPQTSMQKAELEIDSLWNSVDPFHKLKLDIANLKLDLAKKTQNLDQEMVNIFRQTETQWRDLEKEELALVQKIEEKEKAQLAKLHNVLNHVHIANLPADKAIFLLKEKTTGEIVSIRMPNNCTDRYQINASLLVGHNTDGTPIIESLWVHYRPELEGDRQPILLLDENQHPVNDPALAKSIMTIRAGVTAWPEMDEIKPNECGSGLNGSIQKDKPNRLPSQASDDPWATNVVKKDPPPDNRRSGLNTAATSSKRSAAGASQEKISVVPQVKGHSSQGITGGRMWAHDCEDFIHPDGSYGPYGRAIILHINAQNDSHLFNDPPGDINRICPKYKTFNDDQKQNFWVWFAAAIAMEESSCNPEIKVKGTYGIATGLWQLDQGKTKNYCGGVCGSINALDGAKNVRCGLDMLNYYVGESINKGELVYWHNKFGQNYWQTMHPPQPGQRKTQQLVNTFQACK